jgi:DNA-binding NtrC family response regulator
MASHVTPPCPDTSDQPVGETDRSEAKPVVMLHSPDGHLRRLREIEREVICMAMSRYRGNLSQTARALNISRSTLQRKLDEHRLRKRT